MICQCAVRENSGGVLLFYLISAVLLKKAKVYDIIIKKQTGCSMNFSEIANARYSCRKYDKERAVEDEKLRAILESAVLSPSACNGQPYHITVCRGETADEVARASKAPGFNGFVSEAPVLMVISEMPYNKTAAVGAKLKKNDYRSIDIGILAAYITAEAAAQGLGSCIIGWFNNEKIKNICSLSGDVRLIISLGYPLDELRSKKRKSLEELVSYK